MAVAKKQIDRFREAAHEGGAGESDDALDRIFGRLDLRKKPEAEDDEGRAERDNEGS